MCNIGKSFEFRPDASYTPFPSICNHQIYRFFFFFPGWQLLCCYFKMSSLTGTFGQLKVFMSFAAIGSVAN